MSEWLDLALRFDVLDSTHYHDDSPSLILPQILPAWRKWCHLNLQVVWQHQYLSWQTACMQGIRGLYSSAETGEIGGPNGSRDDTGGYHSSLEIGGPHGSRGFVESGGPYGSRFDTGGPYGSLQTGGSHSSTVLIDGGGLYSSGGGLGGYRSTREIAGGPHGSLQTGGSHSSAVLIDGGGFYSSEGGLGGYGSTREIRGSISSADMGHAGRHMAMHRAESGQILRLSDYRGAAALTPAGEYAGLLMSPDLVGLTPCSGELLRIIGWPFTPLIAQHIII